MTNETPAAERNGISAPDLTIIYASANEAKPFSFNTRHIRAIFSALIGYG